MRSVFDYVIVCVCVIAILLELMRLVKLLADPKFLRHPVFDMPDTALRKVSLSLCVILVMLLTAMLKLDLL
jgi:hypothetical protein